MPKWIAYFFWKRKALKAVEAGLTATCLRCDDPIVPGDFVAVCYDNTGIGVRLSVKDGEEVKLIHAGYHFSMSEMDDFCESGAVGCAFWNGKQAVGIGESLAEKVLRTGQPQVM